MFTTSTAAAAPSSPPVSSTSPELIASPPPPPPPALSLSPPSDLIPERRITSKSSLRSLRSFGSSTHEDDADDTLDPAAAADDKSLIRPSILRRLSPGLAARVKLLDGSNKLAALSRNSPSAIGRIPEEQIKVLDYQHQDLSIKVERKGRAWHGLHLPLRDRKQHPGSDHLEGLDRDLLPELSFSDSDQGFSALESTPTIAEADQTVQSPNLTIEPEEPSPTMSAVDASPVSTVLPPTMAPNTQEPTDFEQYVQRTRDIEATRDSQAMPPPPPPKDEPRPTSSASASMSAFFNPKQRPGSMYSFSSFSRVPFLKQVQQLTSIPLPPPSSIKTSVEVMPNAPGAVQAVMGAGEQVQRWIKKAEHVLGGLDVDDEVDWAASGGREGIEEIDKAIAKFDGLINAYVMIIEGVQLRDDIGDVNPDNLETVVSQMDFVLQSWTTMKTKLRVVKGHVELAMEWEELWDSVFGDVETEVDELTQQLYQLEEKRHQVMNQPPPADQEPIVQALDINELETIVEETPSHGNIASHKRLSMGSIFAVPATTDTPAIQTPHDDSYHSDLIAIFARLQPLRASLDFVPMRLSMFQARATKVYPSACRDLDERRSQLDQGYQALEKEAESLRKEFSEDRWILVFRNAGSQAQKMFESVERSIVKLQDGIEAGAHVHNPGNMAKRVESYEAKKQHYIPAIERVVSIVQKGINDRLTVNGETVTLLSDMRNKVDALKASIRVMDSSLDEYHIPPSHQLRDSISTILTMDSPASIPDTPGSSPASSVIMTPANALKGSSTPLGSSSRRGSSVSSAARSTLSKVRRLSGLAQPPASLATKKSAIPKLMAPSPAKMNVAATPTPAARKIPRPAPAPAVKDKRPRWNASTNTNDLDVGHVYWRASSPSPFRKSSGHMSRPASTLPGLSVRDMSASPAPSTGRSLSRLSSRFTSRSPGRSGSPTPTRGLLDPPPYSKLRRAAEDQENFPTTPRNRQSYAAPSSFSRSVSQEHGRGLFSPTKSTRPGTALGHSGSRRISLLPMPKPQSGRESAAGNRSKLSDRPRWR
ncbi:hypothetical protein FE257_012892 [Aspergillus nanangensis]|uniref:Cortical protein KAR9-domain-containing protein n=1 Tax=Aspergillus nanangensis TaxID=2582783 RepID=A0AAD4CFA4_ASPNN|nr:hypothetical protein FE257_012892 [Aspergillus nanangensis]